MNNKEAEIRDLKSKLAASEDTIARMRAEFNALRGSLTNVTLELSDARAELAKEMRTKAQYRAQFVGQGKKLMPTLHTLANTS